MFFSVALIVIKLLQKHKSIWLAVYGMWWLKNKMICFFGCLFCFWTSSVNVFDHISESALSNIHWHKHKITPCIFCEKELVINKPAGIPESPGQKPSSLRISMPLKLWRLHKETTICYKKSSCRGNCVCKQTLWLEVIILPSSFFFFFFCIWPHNTT